MDLVRGHENDRLIRDKRARKLATALIQAFTNLRETSIYHIYRRIDEEESREST